jgi:hypothetical protein
MKLRNLDNKQVITLNECSNNHIPVRFIDESFSQIIKVDGYIVKLRYTNKQKYVTLSFGDHHYYTYNREVIGQVNFVHVD